MVISSHLRTKITLAVTRGGQWSGRLLRLDVAIYRGLEGVHLMIRNGNRWRHFEE